MSGVETGAAGAVATALLTLGEGTVGELGRATGLPAAIVELTVRGDRRFSGPWPRGGRGQRRQVWKLTATASATTTRRVLRARRATQADRILELLADGGWHTTQQILRFVPCIVHSRIAELNRRGFVIEHEGGGGGAANHRYRLLAEPDTRLAGAGSGSASGRPSLAPPATPPGPGGAPPAAQESLFGEAA